MGNPIITAENLGKKYLLTHQRREPYTALRDVIAEKAKDLGRHLTRPFTNAPSKVLDPNKEEFWALKDVSFDVNEGDRIGIIGRNGAGKTTLLKILSRITEPTEGRVRIRGRVASLLEVGTGFHPELTGRENIFLNGAILGMTKSEISRKFDEIVSFAEVERFLDTPVKRYSSGMYVRLAFSVAAHLEPEILVVDEVLAVGDAQFQKKCLGKMEEVGKAGRTVLFVSHNMNAVERLCNRALILTNGKLHLLDNNVRFVVMKYLSAVEDNVKSYWENINENYNNPYFSPVRFYLGDSHGNMITMPVANDQDVFVHIDGTIEVEDIALQVGYALFREDNQLLYWSLFNDTQENDWPKIKKGNIRFYSILPKRFLNEGIYRLELISALYYREWIIEPNKNAPQIILQIQGGLSDSPYWMVQRPGLLAPVIKWNTR